MSMLSFEPATTTDGLCASMATAGSFCLFCENGDAGLATVTSVPVAGPACGWTAAATAPTEAPIARPIVTTTRPIRIHDIGYPQRKTDDGLRTGAGYSGITKVRQIQKGASGCGKTSSLGPRASPGQTPGSLTGLRSCPRLGPLEVKRPGSACRALPGLGPGRRPAGRG